MCHLRHRLRIFLFDKKIVPFSKYSSFCILNHPMFYQIFDVMMSIITRDMVHFYIYLLNHNSLTHQTWSIDRCKQGQYFSEIFWAIQKTGAKVQAFFNLATCSNYLRTNYIRFPVLHFFERVNNWKALMYIEGNNQIGGTIWNYATGTQTSWKGC